MRYEFNLTLGGDGETREEAWQDAIESFQLDPDDAPAIDPQSDTLNQIEDFIANNYEEPMSSSDKAEMFEHIVDLMDKRKVSK